MLRRPIVLRPLLAAAALLVIATPAMVTRAADEAHVERLRLEQMRRFLEQQQPVEPLTRMAATPCIDGAAGSYPCNNVDLLAFMPLSQIGGSSGSDIWGWTDPTTGKEYAIMGRESGSSFVDISDPIQPIYLGNLPAHSASSPWRDIKVYADHAYIVSEALGHGMQVFDLTQLRTVVSPPVTFSETAHYDDFDTAHNIAINEETGFAYVVGTATCSGGLHFIDLLVPAAPVFAGCHVEDNYTHDAQCVVYSGPDAEHQGAEICIDSNLSKINIVDVTNKAGAKVLSEITYQGWDYVHQGWLTEDQVYYLQGDEGDEQTYLHNTRTRIFDVSDLDTPVLIGFHDGPSRAIDHNLYVSKGIVYAANYRAGLRILDVSDVGSGALSEVAYFDIYPSSDSANFNGAWSVYPYFDSGVVVVSGIEQGLFILQPQLPPVFELSVDPTRLRICEPGSETATVTLTDRYDYVGDVTLSIDGLPAGASHVFSTNPVTLPGTSDLTVTTSGVAMGVYALTVSATDGTLTRDAAMELDVVDTPPTQPAPMMPVDGAINVSRTPTLEWSAVSQSQDYHLEVATDPGFVSIVYAVSTSATRHTVGIELGRSTTYYWRVRGANACGIGVNSAMSSFTTVIIPPILLVDDDDNAPDVRDDYTRALNTLGRSFDIWDTGNSDAEPSAAVLAPYTAVIWFTGAESGGSAGPGPGGESALASWLDRSGCLMIGSQDYYRDRGLSGLMQSHLGVGSAVSDAGHTTADGQGVPFGGLGPYTLALPYANFTDTINPGQGASTAFRASPGKMAVSKDANLYRATYWGFGLEGFPTAANREEVLGAFLGWCDALSALDADGDGTTNGTDCAPGDGDTWDVPSPASDLVVGIAAADNLSWQPSAAPGGATVLYDVLRSSDPADFDNPSCVETAGTDTIATEPSDPPAGQLFCYLVRARNACGGTLGPLPSRSGGTCP